MQYRILWIDDKYKEFDNFLDTAATKQIEMLCFDNATDGLASLKSNLKDIDAIILDGKFYLDANDAENDVTSDKAFGLVAKYLDGEKNKGNYIPWFIYSGQTHFAKESHVLVETLGESAFGDGRVFDKNIIEDDEFFNTIISAVKESTAFKIRNKYSAIFQIVDDNYLGKTEEDRIMTIIKNLESSVDDYKSNDLFTPIRKILENQLFIQIDLLSAFRNNNLV